MIPIEIKLESFQGPIDLLYKLIEKNKINIYNIPIVELTDQYINFIKDFPEDMDSLSEFLLMAATLLEIKSKMLLPEIKDTVEEDPREELVNKLVEYKKFKEISIKLKEMSLTSYCTLYKKPEKEVLEIIEENTYSKELEKIPLEILVNIYKDIINRKELKIDKIRSNFTNIKKDIFTVKDKIEYIIYMVEKNEILSVKEIFNKYTSKEEKVITFIAILELIKTKNIKAYQENIREDIIIRKY